MEEAALRARQIGCGAGTYAFGKEAQRLPDYDGTADVALQKRDGPMQYGLYLTGTRQRILVSPGGHEPNRRLSMATSTYTDVSLRNSARSRGFMRNMLDRVIEAREREARRYVDNHFTMMGREEFGSNARESLFEGRAPERG
jgi:hypothetical protein